MIGCLALAWTLVALSLVKGMQVDGGCCHLKCCHHCSHPQLYGKLTYFIVLIPSRMESWLTSLFSSPVVGKVDLHHCSLPQSYGKLTYFITLFPYLVLAIFLVMGSFEEGFAEGITQYYLKVHKSSYQKYYIPEGTQVANWKYKSSYQRYNIRWRLIRLKSFSRTGIVWSLTTRSGSQLALRFANLKYSIAQLLLAIVMMMILIMMTTKIPCYNFCGIADNIKFATKFRWVDADYIDHDNNYDTDIDDDGEYKYLTRNSTAWKLEQVWLFSTVQFQMIWPDLLGPVYFQMWHFCQIFYSLGVGVGSQLLLCSYNSFNTNCHRHHHHHSLKHWHQSVCQCVSVSWY